MNMKMLEENDEGMIFLNNKNIIYIVGNKHNCVYITKPGGYIQLFIHKL